MPSSSAPNPAQQPSSVRYVRGERYESYPVTPPPVVTAPRGHKPLALAALAVLIAAGIWIFLPSDSAVIRQHLKDLEAAVSKNQGESLLSLAGRMETLRRLFDEKCRLELGPPFREILTSRKMLEQVFAASWQATSELHVRFETVEIEIGPAGRSAASRVTALVRKLSHSYQAMESREYLLSWKKDEAGDWRICAVRPAEAAAPEEGQ